MNLSTSSRRGAAAAILGLVTVFALGASAVLGGAPSASPVPSNPPASATPSPTASPQPTAVPSPAPTVEPDGVFDIDLKNLTGNDVSVRISDATGSVVAARSGTPGDGMSGPWFDAIVENVDADSIRIVFVGLPRDEGVRLSVSERAGILHLGFVQAAPPADSDAVGFDRILVLDFEGPVSADGAVVTFAD